MDPARLPSLHDASCMLPPRCWYPMTVMGAHPFRNGSARQARSTETQYQAHPGRGFPALLIWGRTTNPWR